MFVRSLLNAICPLPLPLQISPTEIGISQCEENSFFTDSYLWLPMELFCNQSFVLHDLTDAKSRK